VKTNRYDHISDGELLERYYADQDQQWIGILLERYTLLLLGVCMKYLKNETEARDAVQQVFLKVLMEVSKYRIDYFKSWLYMVAKNHCLMRIRALKGKQYREVADNLPAEEGNDPQELVQNEKAYDFLEEALKELNEEQRQCVTLFYLDKKSYLQITEKTGFSMLQVKSYIQNGKRNLRILIEKKQKEAQNK
jgi:RNA polymerase sigma-70 factor (ECF subfamily)